MKTISLYLIALIAFVSCKNEVKKGESVAETTEEVSEVKTEESNLEHTFEITPISHATMVLEWDGTIIYVDPVGGATAFEGQPEPDLVLVTDIHGDHLNTETIDAIITDGTKIIAPQAVADNMPANQKVQTAVLNNGETSETMGFTVEAIPMYNLREEALKFHAKGRGNGYVIEKDDKRVYISGDTEDIPEMRALQNIDVAFVCMNLPYTMPVKSAASAVVDFKPKKVYPYHYRGTDGLSDVGLFRDWIKKSSASKDIEVVQLDWYPSAE
tara:strand:- start:47 stop:856 length:810 start_codon:yes stop_codon:yes gene_type:complete